MRYQTENLVRGKMAVMPGMLVRYQKDGSNAEKLNEILTKW